MPGRIDGCSTPAFALPLDRPAPAFARFDTGTELSPGFAAAARRRQAAMAAVSEAVPPIADDDAALPRGLREETQLNRDRLAVSRVVALLAGRIADRRAPAARWRAKHDALPVAAGASSVGGRASLRAPDL